MKQPHRYGRCIVFGGTFGTQTRKQLEAQATKRGYIVSAHVSCLTNLFIYGDNVAKRKLLESEELGAKVLSQVEWNRLLYEDGIEEGIKEEILNKVDADTHDGNEVLSTSRGNKESAKSKGGNGAIVVFTGKLTKYTRSAASHIAIKHGYIVGNSITKDTNVLVCGERVGATKTLAAEKFGVEIISEAEWDVVLAGGGRWDGDYDEESGDDAYEKGETSTVMDGKKRTRDTGNGACVAKKMKSVKNGEKNHQTAELTTPNNPCGQQKEVVVFTGTLNLSTRKEATALAQAKGMRVEPSITKSTTVVVYGDRAGQKLDKAKQLGITTLSEEEWQARLCSLASQDDKVESAKSTALQLEDDEPSYDPATAAINGIYPLTLIPDGTFHDVKSSSSNNVYNVKRIGRVYSCNCMAWRNQHLSPSTRTCKHLREVLGEEYEVARVGSSATALRGHFAKSASPDVLLAKKWDRETQNPVGWWISEKLDGVRAYWKANQRQFLSRNGNVYPAPDWFIANFPDDNDLDGELFGGRGKFQYTVGVAKTIGSKGWSQLVYKVFDVPSIKAEPFESRMSFAQKMILEINSPYLEWVEHYQCKSLQHLDEEFNSIEKLGGEGLMLREPKSKYMGGRSSSLLKIKSFHDGEARVIAHEKGKGKYSGMCGALRCQMASGKMFKVSSGLSDAQRENPPTIGTIIVYKCQELTDDGIPRFPIFVGVAADKVTCTDPIVPNEP